MSPDRTQKAVFVSKEGRDLVQRPIWSPGPGEVLIKSTSTQISSTHRRHSEQRPPLGPSPRSTSA